MATAAGRKLRNPRFALIGIMKDRLDSGHTPLISLVGAQKWKFFKSLNIPGYCDRASAGPHQILVRGPPISGIGASLAGRLFGAGRGVYYSISLEEGLFRVKLMEDL